MKQQHYIAAILTLLALTACTNDGQREDKGLASLQVNTNIASTTRTMKYSGLQENALSTTIDAAVYVYREGTKAVTSGYGYENIPYRYVSDEWKHQTLFFPTDWDDVDVFVYAPRSTTKPEGVTLIPITVKTDQSTTAGYLASDFVFGRANVDYAYPTTTTNVTLYHALSKLILNFTDVHGVNSTLGTLTKVELGTTTYAIRLNAYVDITTPITAVADISDNNAVTTLADYGIVKLLDVANEAPTETHKPWSVACILPPQTLPTEGTNLTLTFSTGKTYEGILNATLVAGYTHTYTVTIDQESLTFSGVTIQPWEYGWGKNDQGENNDPPSRIIY